MITIEEPAVAKNWALFSFGFRPFFLGAAIFAVFATLAWMAIYTFNQTAPLYEIPSFTWHAHEMIYGYSIAVIAGFLLTAVSNWTNRATLNGAPLALLFLLWLSARVLPFLGDTIPLTLIAIIDSLFVVFLMLATAVPIVKAKLWVHLGIMAKLGLMLASNIVFYLGALGILTDGIYLGLYSGLYLIIALIFTLGRRVIPFFIERGVGYPVTLTNWKWLDISSLVIFLFFWLAELFSPTNKTLIVFLSALLLVLHSIRLVCWHTPGIWKKPLLWVLYLAYALITTGFALKIAALLFDLSPFLAVHAFAFGGIGLMTLGMMARVSLGHTGRSIFDPPASLPWIFMVLFIGALIRVFLPLLAPSHYLIWIGLSQLFWVIAFTGFIVIYFPILTKPRADGRPG